MERTSVCSHGLQMAWTVAEKPAAEPLHRAAPEGGTPMRANPQRVSPWGYQMWDTSGHGSFVPLGPHRPFFDWENGRAMYTAVPLGDETLQGEAEIHPSSCAPLHTVGCPRKDPQPWE